MSSDKARLSKTGSSSIGFNTTSTFFSSPEATNFSRKKRFMTKTLKNNSAVYPSENLNKTLLKYCGYAKNEARRKKNKTFKLLQILLGLSDSFAATTDNVEL